MKPPPPTPSLSDDLDEMVADTEEAGGTVLEKYKVKGRKEKEHKMNWLKRQFRVLQRGPGGEHKLVDLPSASANLFLVSSTPPPPFVFSYRFDLLTSCRLY